MTIADSGIGPLAPARPVLRRIGSSDLVVYPLALSGNVFGWTADARATGEILDAYHDHGGAFVDTADAYASGRSEQMIGSWMRSRRVRDEIVVATKIGKSAENPGLSRRAVVASVEASLERLQTDRIDLLYLHVDDQSVPFEQTLLAVDQLIRAGKVRWFGGSDHAADRLIEARIASGQVGVAPMVALQNQYNLLHRHEYEKQLAVVAMAQGLGFMPRFALAGGLLSGKYRTRADFARSERDWSGNRHLARRGLRVYAALDRIALAHGVAPATIALAWLLAQPLVVAPVVSASRPEQVPALIAATSLELTPAQLAELDKASA